MLNAKCSIIFSNDEYLNSRKLNREENLLSNFLFPQDQYPSRNLQKFYSEVQ